MQELTFEQVEVVSGGTETVAGNAEVAKDVCGKNGVKSVTTTGFECFPPPAEK